MTFNKDRFHFVGLGAVVREDALVNPLVVCSCVLAQDVLTSLILVLGCLYLFLVQMSIVECEQ